jgi:uncharacterized Zn-finger protein
LFIPDPDPGSGSGFLSIPDPGSKGKKGTGSRNRFRNAGKYALLLQCELCGRGFPLGSLLERHVRTHTLANRIACPYCGKSYGSKATYNYHMFSKHSGKEVMEIRHSYV